MGHDEQRQIKLGLFLQGAGVHSAGWRYPDAESGPENFDLMRRAAQTAERGKMDMVFLGDALSTSAKTYPSFLARFEPITLLTALGMVTDRIGLAATASTTYSEPYNLARLFASLDLLSRGRSAWNVVTSAAGTASKNFGFDKHEEHAHRYERAHEFVEVVKGLWDSFEDEALIKDKEAGVYLADGTLRELNYAGKHYNVKGPLNVPRPVQGHSVIIQAGSSDPGQELAARTADVVFTAQQKLEDGQAFYKGLKARLAQYGRTGDQLLVMPGVVPIIGLTEQEARQKYNKLNELINLDIARAALSGRLEFDLAPYPLDGPLPEIPEANGNKSRFKLLHELAAEKEMTIRDLCYLVGGSGGHRIIVGTPEQIADNLELWFHSRAADGFNIMPPYFPGGVDDFVDYVIPELQQRGLFRTDYEGDTLRDHLGLTRPENTLKHRDDTAVAGR